MKNHRFTRSDDVIRPLIAHGWQCQVVAPADCEHVAPDAWAVLKPRKADTLAAVLSSAKIEIWRPSPSSVPTPRPTFVVLAYEHEGGILRAIVLDQGRTGTSPRMLDIEILAARFGQLQARLRAAQASAPNDTNGRATTSVAVDEDLLDSLQQVLAQRGLGSIAPLDQTGRVAIAATDLAMILLSPERRPLDERSTERRMKSARTAR